MKENNMSAQKKFFITIIVAVVLGIGAFAVVAMNKNSNDVSMEAGMSGHSEGSSDQAHHTEIDIKDTVEADKVDIKSFAYGPENINVKVGTTVTWTNQDGVRHDVTGHDGKGPQSELLGKGESYSYTFKEAGTFDYHCSPHPYMIGTVIVTE